MATVPNLKGFLSDSGSPLFILPQRVKLWKGEQKGQKRNEKEKEKREKKRECVCPPVNPPSAMLNMNLCLVAFFFSSLTLTAGAAVPPSLVFSPFCNLPDSSVFTLSFSSLCSVRNKRDRQKHVSSKYTKIERIFIIFIQNLLPLWSLVSNVLKYFIAILKY